MAQAAQKAGQAVAVQRFSLNPLDLAKKVWDGIKGLGSAALSQAKSLGSAALGKVTAFGSGLASRVGAAITSALSAIAGAARSGLAKLGDAVKSALQALGNLARQGLSAVGKVARAALDGALRLGKAAWDKAASAGRKALAVAMSAGRAVRDAGKALASKAWSAVKGNVSGLWNGLKAKAKGLKDKVLSTAKGLLAKAKSLGGRALAAASALTGKIGGSICSAIGKATAWVYGKVAPLAKQAWEWVKANPAKAIAAALIPGGPLIGLAVVLQTKMLEFAKKLFAPVVRAVAAKAKAAWSKAKEWGAKAFNTAKQWAGKALTGATALGKKALTAATNFGRQVIGKAKDLGGKVIGKAKEWGQQVMGKAKALGSKVWGQAQELGGKLLGVADSLTGGMASKVKGLADKLLGKAAGVLSWVLSKAKSLASRALSAAKALASKVLAKAKDMASKAWNKAKDLGSKIAGKAKDFASTALAKGKDLLAKAGKAAVDFGKKALQGAKDLAAKAVAKAKEWGAKAWSLAKEWGGKAWAKAKEWGGKAWDWTKKKAGEAWSWAKGIAAKLAPFAKQAWEWAKRIGKAIGVDKAIAAVAALGKKALGVAKKGLVFLKDKVLPIVEQLRQVRNKVMSYTPAGLLCKAVGCAYKGFIPKAGQDVESGLDLSTDIIPVVSTVKDTCTCLVGENFVTNKQVGGTEQGMACAFAAIDIAGYAAAAFTGGGTAAGAMALRATLKGGIKVGGKVIAKEALEAAIKKGGRELVEKLGKEGLQELTEKLGKEGLQELAERMGREEFEKLAKEAAEQGVKGFDDILQKGAKEAGGEAAEKGAKETGGSAGEKGAKTLDEAGVTAKQLDDEMAAVAGGKRRPSTLAGYADEVELPNGHTWRRSPEGHWCRFSNDPFCPVGAADKIERNLQLGELRRYKTQHAADTLNAAEQAELASLTRRLERGEVSAAQARKEYEALLDKARARREGYKPAEFLDTAKEHKVSGETGKRMDAIEADRVKLQDRRAKLANDRAALAKKLGLDPDNIDEVALTKLRRQGKLTEARRLQNLDQQYKELGTALVRKSEELGQVATRDFAQKMGAKPLYEGAPGTAGTLDAVFHKPGPPVTLFVCEAKGGGSQLGTRMIGGAAYEQGTPEYLRWMLQNDKGFREAAERAGLLKLIEKGEITIEYHLVQAKGGQKVLVNQFDIRPRP